MRALLISTYEMGRQPFGLASPVAWLRAAGWTVDCADVSREPLREDVVAAADLVCVYLPMHTAARLAAPVIAKVRRLNASGRICAYGLYAPLNAEWLQSLGVQAVFGGEFEAELTEYAERISTMSSVSSVSSVVNQRPRSVPHIKFLVPDRSGLPPLSRYATLQKPDGTKSLVGYTEASRGCRHLCRHCPIVPIYNGQFRIVQPDVVLADIDAQVAAGAHHITFGDPDFFNGPTHAMRIIAALHDAHPTVTYDVTIKIEHLLRHRDLLPRLRDTGCLFITTAVESIDDEVLALLQKDHTRDDFFEAVECCRHANLTLVPTFVAFNPWTTLDAYCELLDTLDSLDMVEHVAPIQLAIRLLIPRGSRLLEVDAIQRVIERFDPGTLTYRWRHADPEVDRLHEQVTAIVGVGTTSSRRSIFETVRDCAYASAGRSVPRPSGPARDRTQIPYLNEPWYC